MTPMNTTLTEQDIQEYIYQSIPGISYSEMWKVRNMFIYEFTSLETAVFMYKRHLQVKEWNKSKDKHYYRVPMLNGGHKYVYMCEEMVKDFYGWCGYELIG